MLGCIADDYTGASDVATALSRAGLRAALVFGVPDEDFHAGDAGAVVVGLKIRTAPRASAVRAALDARSWLERRGAERFYFKYCSTFDSTDDGNIGPIADALVDSLGGELTVVCPAAPEHGRTVYQGHLFVGERLLSDTPMRDHPLTPMRDPSVVRMLARQTEAQVELVPHARVRAGTGALERALGELRGRGVRFAVVDALSEGDLSTIATAAAGMRLVTGAAGLAPHLGRVAPSEHAGPLPLELPPGPTAILAASCSAATLEQVERARGVLASLRVDPRGAAGPDALLSSSVRWLDENLPDGPVLVYSSAPADERSSDDAPAVERLMGAVARHLVDRGVRRLVVAGGETSAAVVDAVGVSACAVGEEEARGVPWLVEAGPRGLALLLKSGNFGDPELFVRAAERAA